MELLSSAVIGYGLGCLSPAALISKLKNIDLRTKGTKNLGGSNTMLVIGRAWGILVMLLDILKAYFAVKIAKWLFPQVTIAQLVAGLFAVIGHVFPFYLGFKGGKGLAAFGGLILAFDPWIFLNLLVVGLILMFATNASVAVPLSAGTLFPILVGFKYKSILYTGLCAASGLLIVVKHWGNLKRIRAGKDLDIRSFFKNGLKQK